MIRRSTSKKILLILLKFGLPVIILGGLLATMDRDQLKQLQARTINWPLVAGAFAAAFGAVGLSFYRWYFLVRALGVPFRVRDAFRLGFLGYLFNFVSVGVVGGDLFKAIFIAREQPGRRTLAVASVMVDRVIGLYALLLVTSVALLFTAFPADAGNDVIAVRNTTFVATIVGGIGLLLIISPGFTTGPIAEWATGLPRIGNTFERLIFAMRCYRTQPMILVVVMLQSFGVHGLITVSIYFLAQGLYSETPTFAEHLIIVPLSNLAGAMPFTPGGLGTMELAMKALYQIVPAKADVDGLIIALAYRLITIAIAGVGIVIYWFSRRELQRVMLAGSRNGSEGADT